MNRPRKEDECFQCYRRHLKEEAAELKQYLRGRNVWVSSIITVDPKDTETMPLLRKTVKLPVRGAFCRAQGHEMRTSLIEQERKEKVRRALEKEGIL
jgi:hypothetical protein